MTPLKIRTAQFIRAGVGSTTDGKLVIWSILLRVCCNLETSTHMESTVSGATHNHAMILIVSPYRPSEKRATGIGLPAIRRHMTVEIVNR